MIFSKTKLSDAYIIEIEKFEDERGFFARIWDKEKFLENGINDEFLQHSISLSKKKGTIRGMHYQIKPFEESKIVRCTRGRIFDVIIDLRPDSKTFKEWFGIELSENNYRCLYIPKGKSLACLESASISLLIQQRYLVLFFVDQQFYLFRQQFLGAKFLPPHPLVSQLLQFL